MNTGVEFGVAFFDSTNTKDGGGWYSMNGERAMRFNGFSDLDARHVWITNLAMSDFYEQGLSKAAHLRNSSFFHQTLQHISNDCGFQQGSSIPLVVEQLSGIAARVMEISKLCMPGLRILKSLHDSIYDFIGLDDIKDDAACMYQPEFQAAFQENSYVAGIYWPRGIGTARLSMNRVDFAEEVLGYPFPIGAWHYERSNMSVDDFINLDVPAIACVEVDLKSANKPELLAFGAQMSGTAVMREWITQPEAAMLKMADAKIRISNILRGSAINDSVELPSLLTGDALIRSSYSAGLVAENYLHALTSKRYDKRTRNSRNTYFFPSRAVYLKAVDRMLSYSLARQMSDRDHIVSMYGFGAINILVTEDLFAEAVKDAADMGFAIVSSKFKQE
ncbi:hypothetical protein GALL_118060 [mine drainage metagenome]|uniref:Uncharacterized protein n=1 Tax=mine drainage metagenome TaxID=410659 RepID=A0A1J5SBX6_9ZZZZ